MYKGAMPNTPNLEENNVGLSITLAWYIHLCLMPANPGWILSNSFRQVCLNPADINTRRVQGAVFIHKYLNKNCYVFMVSDVVHQDKVVERELTWIHSVYRLYLEQVGLSYCKQTSNFAEFNMYSATCMRYVPLLFLKIRKEGFIG